MTPVDARSLALTRIVVSLVTAAREGQATFVDLLAKLCADVEHDQTHPLHPHLSPTETMWALTQFGMRCATAVALLTAGEAEPDPFASFLLGYALEHELAVTE